MCVSKPLILFTFVGYVFYLGIMYCICARASCDLQNKINAFFLVFQNSFKTAKQFSSLQIDVITKPFNLI